MLGFEKVLGDGIEMESEKELSIVWLSFEMGLEDDEIRLFERFGEESRLGFEKLLDGGTKIGFGKE